MTEKELSIKNAAIKMLFKGISEEKVMNYADEQVDHNPFVFKYVWQEVLFWQEFLDDDKREYKELLPF